ncbi:MAG: NADPH-dependent assimilatory sulfite reductase hemoprotein subunit [Gammaproteobacteria bacterium]
MSDTTTLSDVERIKTDSDFLRGTLDKSLRDPITGAIAPDDTQLSKFHGLYQQDDRDQRSERSKQKLEPLYSFMLRARVPGGVCTPQQWLGIDALARRYGGDRLRLTTRQAFQLHGVIKNELKATIADINANMMDTIAACGDVNRNVMCTPLHERSQVHREALVWCQRISDLLTPRTRAYHEIWLDGKKLETPDHEPIYGPTYLPRKFKTAVAIAPINDVDVLAHDLGFTAIEDNGALAGFNVSVGGGMGATHGDAATYPRLADVIGFCTPEQVLAVAEHVVTIQRDFGDRSNRKHARLKYTIEDRGVAWFTTLLEKRTGFALAPARSVTFKHRGDLLGWFEDAQQKHHLTLFIPSGRIEDRRTQKFLTGLHAIASLNVGEFRITPNQNLIIAGLDAAQREKIDTLTQEFGIDLWRQLPPIEQTALACVALPTCSLAMAEAERGLPDIVARVDRLMQRHGLKDEPLSLRVTGCPNGCARPYVAEIGLIGKAPGRYNLHLGGDANGTRLNRHLATNLSLEAIEKELDQRFADFARERQKNETFGDYTHRTQLERTP